MRDFLTCSFLFLLCAEVSMGAANSVVSLSHYDERAPDFIGMQRAGVEGIIHEATYPGFEFDEKYASRQSEASRAGLLWGAYHFGNATDGARQADYFLEAVARSRSARSEGVLLVLDAERNTHYSGGTMQVEQAVRFVRRVRDRTGQYPGIYSNENWLKQLFSSSSLDFASRQILGKCWIWVANYHEVPNLSGPRLRWAFWQYTGDGVCGLPRSQFPTDVANMHNVERTIFSGSRETMRRFWADHAWHADGEMFARRE
jgi:lysozyme